MELQDSREDEPPGPILEEAQLFDSWRIQISNATHKRARKSHVPRSKVKNRRTVKKCPVCMTPGRQIARHLKSQHRNLSKAQMADAILLLKPYNRTVKPQHKHPEYLCPICKNYRVKLDEHLRRVHHVTRLSAEIKNKGGQCITSTGQHDFPVHWLLSRFFKWWHGTPVVLSLFPYII
mgnify:FL=1